MLNFRRLLNFGALISFLILAAVLPAFPQATVEQCTSIYQVLTSNQNSAELVKVEQALSSGKEYLEKCKNLSAEGSDRIVTYITNQIPKLERSVDTLRIERSFNNALAQRNRDELISTAKKLLERNRPYSLDLVLDIVSIGFDSASLSVPNDKYNDDAITFANLALKKLEAGENSGNKDKFGFYVAYKTDKCADGRANAIGWMHYTIGFIKFTRKKDSKDALPYLYRASQNGCETKTFSENYRLIGSWYIDESNLIGEQRKQLLTAAENKETPETASMFELQMAYIDRAIDAYARAYRQASISPKAVQAYKDALLNKLKELFAVRYEGDTSKMDAYVSKVSDTPFPDPSTPVAPPKTTP